jgi:hypothetical protein
MCSPISPSFILSLLHTFVPLLAPLATQPLFGTLTSAGTTARITPAPGRCSARYPLRPESSSARRYAVPLRSDPRRLSPARPPACRMRRQRLPAAIGSTVPLPVPHAYGCCWPPHHANWFWLDPRSTPCHPRDSALMTFLLLRAWPGLVCAPLVG